MNYTQSRPRLFFIGIFILLVAIRIPFFLTHHIQEDAYITLRCAENLAETGVYGFNPGVRVSASTSHLYVFLAALVRIVAGKDAFIPAVQVVNTLLFVAGTYFIARIFCKPEKQRLFLWIMLSLLPISLLISYSGMETSLLVFLTGLTWLLLQEHKSQWWAGICIAMFPWVRPDAIAYVLIILFWDAIKEKKFKPVLWGGFLLGIGGLLLFNQLYFGALLNQSIIAKAQARHAFSFQEFFATIKLLFLEQNGGIFAPVRSKYLDSFSAVFLGIIFLVTFLIILRNRNNRNQIINSLMLICMSILVPVAYAAGRVIFQWYFWPATFFGYSMACVLLAEIPASGRFLVKIARGLVLILIVAGMAVQWVFSYSWGTKEYAYRGGIGRELAEISHEGDTLFLEPAGYIPFYSGLFTYDEAALVSPQVLHYRDLYETPWWPRFVEDYKPTWIVQREQIAEFSTYQGYTLNEDEQRWFTENYHLVEKKTYQPKDYTSNPLLLYFLSMGTADDYYVFEVNR